MELTITQNGALYALHHRVTKKYRGARKKRVGARTRWFRNDSASAVGSAVATMIKFHRAAKPFIQASQSGSALTNF